MQGDDGVVENNLMPQKVVVCICVCTRAYVIIQVCTPGYMCFLLHKHELSLHVYVNRWTHIFICAYEYMHL